MFAADVLLAMVARIPDPGAPDSGIPDPDVPDSGVPDPGIPDPGAPDPGVSDPGVSDPGILDAGISAALEVDTPSAGHNAETSCTRGADIAAVWRVT
ncbi:MAG: hypothetical protein ACOCWF_05315 [Halochromatium sp.]